ncbi:hypothetical protein A3Q56_05187 [Intoshia linei]|uniref:Uncharacterized protein n=1 Tax=Intoshia linei TaxID=1819745 RepID=A0A177B070_9BILA|nr:hypothetical protein A3Q56_05187 [Intoshia linei]
MRSKSEEETISFPHIYFYIDNYEEIFDDLVICEHKIVFIECVCVFKPKLRSRWGVLGEDRDPKYQLLKLIFSGAIGHSALLEKYKEGGISRLFKKESKCQYLVMRSPTNGAAEMLIRKYIACDDYLEENINESDSTQSLNTKLTFISMNCNSIINVIDSNNDENSASEKSNHISSTHGITYDEAIMHINNLENIFTEIIHEKIG